MPRSSFTKPQDIDTKLKIQERFQYHEKTSEPTPVQPPHSRIRTTQKIKYHVGKQRYNPQQVGVMISNSSMRNTIKQKCNEMKTVPITEIKKQLIKQGLIKVGSSAPNEVIRKIYETSCLVYGDIQNRNSENILHNYLLEQS